MSHVVEFRINGLAGRSEPFKYEMDRHLNVFFGLNGCGKTSLLKILHSAMSNDASLLARVPFESASVTIYSLSFRKEFTRTITKTAWEKQSLTVEDATATWHDERSAIMIAQRERQVLQWKTKPTHEEASKTSWQHLYLPTYRLLPGRVEMFPRLALATSGFKGSVMSEEQIDVFFAESIRQLWGDYTSKLLGSIQNAQEAGLASILKVVLSPKTRPSSKKKLKLDSHQAYERMKKFLTRQGSPQLLSTESDFISRYDEDSTLRRVVLDIDKIEREIEVASAPRRQLEDLVGKLFSGGKSVNFTDQSIDIIAASGAEIGVASLSSGEKQLLMVLVETLLAGESSIIIDEPEISMHVDWQNRLVQIMKLLNPNAQLILATHSPEIMADVPDANIIRM